MHLEKLIAVLKSFDKPRMVRLKAYVSSPYFRIPPVAKVLLERISPLHPDFPEKKITWQKIGRKTPTLSTLAKQWAASSHLLRAVEGFIAQEEWQKDEAEVTRYQLLGYKELQLTEEFGKRFEKEMKQLEKEPEQNFDTFFGRHVLTELSFNGFDAKANRGKNDIIPVVKTLDEFHALKKLRYLCEVLNRQQMFGVNYHDEHIPALFKILEPYTNPQHPYVYLFVNVYRMLAADNFEDCDLYYRLMKQFIERHSNPVLPQSIREAADYATNYCLRWYNKGYAEAGNEYLWWIEWKAKNKLLLQDGKLMPVTFRNIISIAVLSKTEPSSIKRMISDYAPLLPDEYRDTYLAFANGLYHYSVKKYKEAIRFLLMAEPKEVAVFNCIVRLWQWQCLYEYDRNDIDALDSHLRTFEKYLERHKKELQHVTTVFESFIGYSTKLLNTVNPELLSSHVQDLQNKEHFPGKPWLVQQFAAKNKKPVPHRAERVKVS